MKLTAQLKAWLVKHAGVKADASDDEFRSKLAECLTSGALSPDDYAELSKESPEGDDALARIGEVVGKAVGAAIAPVVEKIDKLADAGKAATSGQVDPNAAANGDGGQKAGAATGSGEGGSVADNNDLVKQLVDGAAAAATGVGAAAQGGQAAAEGGTAGKQLDAALGKAADSGATPGSQSGVRVVGVHERYATTRKAAMFPSDHKAFPNMPATYASRQLEHPSDLDKAIAGAWFKFAVAHGGGAVWGIPKGLQMTEHDQDLVKYAIHNCPFTGLLRGQGSEDVGAIKVDGRRLQEGEIKALLDDATGSGSGGLEITPIVFDDAIILTPVLFGELFPLVNIVNISRGRRIEGGTISNPTFTSGTAEGTSIGLFDTSDFIAAFDTTIYNAVGAMEIGMDFEEDSPIAVGSIVTQKYGEKALEWLDTQVATGDGTTEPEGVMNASGVTDIDWGADAATVSDYEGFLFGVSKEYRTPDTRGRQVFCANETTYRRSRSIPVGAADQRRVFGMTHEDYMLLGHPYKIVQAMTNQQAFFGNMARYRMYRRLGLNIRLEQGGKELALKNLRLIVARMRYGGQIEDSNAFVLTDSAEA